jgi:ParB-like chromosome segregation protein Spo0J
VSAGVPLESIKVSERLDPARADLKIAELAESIRRFGLLHPLVVTPDRKLLDGRRRRAALELLAQQGHHEPVLIRVRPAKTEDEQLDIEWEGNAHTEAWSLEAKWEYYRRAKAREQAAAKERMAEGGRGKGGPAGPPLEGEPKKGRAEDIAAEAAGLSRSSARRLDDIMEAVEANPDLAPLRDEVIRTEKINAVHRKLQRAQAAGGKVHDKDSYCTPGWVLAIVHAVEPGGISLDCCSNATADELGHVRARVAWTIDDDCLAQETWMVEHDDAGESTTLLWHQPPYGDPEPTTERLAAEWDAGRLWRAYSLVKLDTSTKWWAMLRERATAIVLFRERIHHEIAPGVTVDETDFCSAMFVLTRGTRAERRELLQQLQEACGDRADVYPGAWALWVEREATEPDPPGDLAEALERCRFALHGAIDQVRGDRGEGIGSPPYIGITTAMGAVSAAERGEAPEPWTCGVFHPERSGKDSITCDRADRHEGLHVSVLEDGSSVVWSDGLVEPPPTKRAPKRKTAKRGARPRKAG